MPKFVLILMVKNESRIIERCMKAVEGVVDAFCVTDTGSTDNTRDIVKEFLKTHKGCLIECEWKNFGHNRSISFDGAQAYLRDTLKWNLTDTYGLLLDGDMVFVPGKLKSQPLGEIGYSIVQVAGNLQYPNCRLVRMDYAWKCKGVTHEYWDGPTTALSKEICHIDDRNDGGCKSDKFTRDAALLEKGLEEEPDNARYMFYLAQTYHSLGRWKDSAAMYKKRITAGGWYEEVWYSHYMIGQCYLNINDPIRFEAWMLRAYKLNPKRAEPIYKLAKYFREVAEHYKAYHYTKLGKTIPLSTESLFVETDVYTGLFDYERSILEYYVHSDKTEGLRASVAYLLSGNALQSSVLSNLEFYARVIGAVEPLTNLPAPFGSEFRPSAISLRSYPLANVRYVNYWIENGDYKTPAGKCVQTENAFVNLDTGELLQKMKDSSVTLPRREVAVKGLEDIRLYGTDRFTATVQEYSDGVRVLEGCYNAETGDYEDCRVLPSPTERNCEKNWLPVGDTGNTIYDWHPLRIIGPNSCTRNTPPMFSLFRGSAPPVKRGDEWLALVHFVQYSKPRKYYHCFVALSKNFVPLRISLPFVFRTPSIEYCVSFRIVDSYAECYVSFMDSEPSRARIPLSGIEWASI
jgi:glycosyltransferase involved in cell wall biosynthesis